MLHVTPSEVWVGLQSECADAGGQGRRSGGARVRIRATLVQVRRYLYKLGIRIKRVGIKRMSWYKMHSHGHD